MNKNYILKIGRILIVTIIAIVFNISSVMGINSFNPNEFEKGPIVQNDINGNPEFDSYGNEIVLLDPEINLSKLQKVFSIVFNIISLIGSILSIVVIIILGIKYMIGSVEERAEYKKTILPYIIGAMFVFGASNLPSFIYSVVVKP